VESSLFDSISGGMLGVLSWYELQLELTLANFGKRVARLSFEDQN
jgi:hypothetical protein